jgi:N-acyl-D-aspartate/D-glutamate deacylase
MTSLAAAQLQIRERGTVREGYFADLVAFDPARVADTATFERPHQFPVGISYVVVNGVVTVEKERHTGARAGRALRGPGWVNAVIQETRPAASGLKAPDAVPRAQ